MTTSTAPTETGDRYKWVALTNTTSAVFMSALDGSIVIISLPAIFRGIQLDPLDPANISYLLWMIMGYRLVQAVLVVSLGRLGDMFGRVRVYNAGFTVFTDRLGDAVLRPVRRAPRRAVADRLARASGHRRVDAGGELGGDPHRRLPAGAARIRTGLQPGGGAGGPVHRSGRRRASRGVGLARGVLGQRARRRVRHLVGLPQAARTGLVGTPPRADRLVGQCHLRGAG